ncbi:MAG: hypothetical protein KatS3mg015_2839 [Fimbriimonadales bacterium]|nr:MAG: hypothetical protein KatS3mg015_2839 [Fimbriimonadales bacterium]
MSSLSDLIARKSSSAPLEEGSVPAPGGASSPVSLLAEEPSSSGAQEPYGVSQVITPKGIGIYYQAGPKRLYRICLEVDQKPEVWVDVPAMSDILSILDKPGLPWWGMKVGVQGVASLWSMVKEGSVDEVNLLRSLAEQDVEQIIALLTKHRLTVNHVRDQAGDRGQDIHDALELWASKGIVPNPAVFGPENAGYVKGLKRFVIDSAAEPVVSEVMVASATLGFAGRFDLGAKIPDGARVVTKSHPKKKSVVEAVPGGTWLLDLKSSKGVYSSHHLQLAGYNLASDESYGVRYDHTGIIHVFPDGRYELVQGKARDEHFRTIKQAFDVMREIK